MSDKEWLQRRRLGIGGSDVAAILGCSPFAGPIDVWLEKTGQAEPDADDTEGERKQKRRGNILEPAVARWYEEETGTSVLSIDQSLLPFRGPEPWMTGSPDRLVLAESGLSEHLDDPMDLASVFSDHPRGLEVKTARSMDGWGDVGTDIVPLYYMLQCIWYMMITNLERWDVAVYFPFYDEFRHYTIARARDVEEEVVTRVGIWRERHIVHREPPPLDASKSASDWLTRRHGLAVVGDRDATPEEEVLAEELRSVQGRIKILEEREANLANTLRDKIGTARGIRGAFGSILWSPCKGRTTVDQKAFAAAHPALFEQFKRVGQPYRMFKPSFKKDQDHG